MIPFLYVTSLDYKSVLSTYSCTKITSTCSCFWTDLEHIFHHFFNLVESLDLNRPVGVFSLLKMAKTFPTIGLILICYFVLLFSFIKLLFHSVPYLTARVRTDHFGESFQCHAQTFLVAEQLQCSPYKY